VALHDKKIFMENKLSVSAVMGPWQGDATTGLMERCRDSWDIPLTELSDLMVATYLNQDIAVIKMCEEAEIRLERKVRDDTEYFDGQLSEALLNAKNRHK
jgi:hypothetical protein